MILSLSRKRVKNLLGGMTGKRILILGDVMLDEFIWGTVRRISPEAPVPVGVCSRKAAAPQTSRRSAVLRFSWALSERTPQPAGFTI